jgi:chloramphenicol O-acetyltransferase
VRTTTSPSFATGVQDDVLVEFDKVIPSVTSLSPEKLLYFAKGVYTDNFEADDAENLESLEAAAKALDTNVGSPNQGQLFITNNPWNSVTATQAPYTRRFASAPVYGIGKHDEEHGCTKAGLGIQNRHGLTDDYHIGHFLDILQRHLDGPKLMTRPFTSTFR